MSSSLWDKVVFQLEKELSSHNFNTWINPIKYESIDNFTVNLMVPNKFFSDWLKDNYKQKVEEILTNLTNKKMTVNIKISNIKIKYEYKEDPIKIESFYNKVISNNTLNDKYTFESFV